MWDISIRQVLSVYSDLVRAIDGKASHGSDVEIYAYRLLPNMPAEHMKFAWMHEDTQSAYLMARVALSGLCECLEMEFNVKTEINGVDAGLWLALQPDFIFDHRVMVSVVR